MKERKKERKKDWKICVNGIDCTNIEQVKGNIHWKMLYNHRIDYKKIFLASSTNNYEINR